jgi:SAM-dependent methyltransferase
VPTRPSDPDRCVVCDATQPPRPRFSKTVAGSTYVVVECRECGFQCVRPTPSDEELHAYYASGVDGDYANYVAAAALKKAHFRRMLDEVEEHLPPPARMLDVGCAAGFLLEVAAERGWDVHGVEISEAFAAATAASVAARITYGRLRDVALEPGYALITLFDVLEHTPTPRQDLERCRDLLAENGAIVVQVPCIDALGRKIMRRRWYHYAPPAHLNYFSNESFARLAASLGLRIVDQRWTRKLLTIDYFVSQVAGLVFGLRDLPKLGAIGRVAIPVPMSERLFVLTR